MQRFAALAGLSARALAEVMADAVLNGDHDATDLLDGDDGDGGGDGWLWHGLSLAMPAPLARVFGKFGKTFVADPLTGAVRGWNVRMHQSQDDTWEPVHVRGRELTYGNYSLGDADPGSPYPGALLIDYGGGVNRPWDPLGMVRDYIAMIEPGLWLGHMYLAVAMPGPLGRVLQPRSVATPSWFALARGRPLAS